MEEITQQEVLLALAATGINLSPGAFRVLMDVPEPKDAINQLVVNYFTAKYVRKTLSEKDVVAILHLSPIAPYVQKNFPLKPGQKVTQKEKRGQGKLSIPPKINPESPPSPFPQAELDQDTDQPPTYAYPFTTDGQYDSVPGPAAIVPPANISEDISSASVVVESAPVVPAISPPSDSTPPTLSRSTMSPTSSGNIGGWHPAAREYSADVRVISDPTQDLHTTGEIDDFLKLFQSRYEKLRKILLQRFDIGDAVPISGLRQSTSEEEVKVIGMVTDKRQAKSKNYLIELEDPTGRIMALISQSKPEMYKLVSNLMLDQVICVSGRLKISEGRSRIIFVEEFFWPDVPMTHRTTRAEDHVCAMCISDLHVGSKEFQRPLWDRLVEFLNGRIGATRQRQLAGEVKYLLIAGDAVDGIGVYPSQENNLDYDDIYTQYAVLQEMLQGIPDYVQIIYIPGNHEPVRNAIPMPAVPRKFAGDLQDNLHVMCLGNPAVIALHGVKGLIFHGDSFIDFSMSIPTVEIAKPETAMLECLRGRHLAPTFGKKTELAPAPLDWLVIDEVPDFFHTGHLHINGAGRYRNILNIGSGCFEAQTEYMKSLGIVPTPGKPFIIRLYEPDLAATQLDLQDIS